MAVVKKSADDLLSVERSGAASYTSFEGNIIEAQPNTLRLDHNMESFSFSTVNLPITSGTKTFPVTYKYPVGSFVRATASSTNFMIGEVVASTESTVTISVTDQGYTGSGYFGIWFLIEVKGLLSEPEAINYVTNSLDPFDQRIQLTSGYYTISFYGSGSVTLSTAVNKVVEGNTAGQIRTENTFHTTGGFVDITITGEVAYLQIERGEFATSWIPSTSSVGYRGKEIISLRKIIGALEDQTATITIDAEGLNRGRRGVVSDSTFLSLRSNGNTEAYNVGVYSSEKNNLSSDDPRGIYLQVNKVVAGERISISDNWHHFMGLRLAIGLNETGMNISLNGGSVVSEITDLPSGFSKMIIGSYNGDESINSWIKSIRFKSAYSEVELVSLSQTLDDRTITSLFNSGESNAVAGAEGMVTGGYN